MFKIPLFKELKTDQWVKPFFKQYKVSLVIALFLGFMTFFSASALMFNSGYLISKSASLPSNILLVYVPIVLTRAFGIGRRFSLYRTPNESQLGITNDFTTALEALPFLRKQCYLYEA